jgi:peptidoglycan hydrolase CwlO-like protein
MTQPVDDSLTLAILKKIQADVSHIRERVDDHHEQLISVREQINTLQAELIRHDKHFTQRLDRIERRLDLTDAE